MQEYCHSVKLVECHRKSYVHKKLIMFSRLVARSAWFSLGVMSVIYMINLKSVVEASGPIFVEF